MPASESESARVGSARPTKQESLVRAMWLAAFIELLAGSYLLVVTNGDLDVANVKNTLAPMILVFSHLPGVMVSLSLIGTLNYGLIMLVQWGFWTLVLCVIYQIFPGVQWMPKVSFPPRPVFRWAFYVVIAVVWLLALFWPPVWLQNYQHRKAAAEVVVLHGGWEELRKGCAVVYQMCKTNDSYVRASRDPVPPIIKALKPRMIEANNSAREPPTVYLQLFGNRRSGQAYYALVIMPQPADKDITPGLSRITERQVKRIADGVFEAYGDNRGTFNLKESWTDILLLILLFSIVGYFIRDFWQQYLRSELDMNP